MTEMFAAVLGTGAWMAGLLLLLVMAALPLLEHVGTARSGR
ncbi:hypothetical protein [Pseudonocardia nigra]|nr:hypothetical protein [Pseudonocardia nigra]